MSDCIILVTDPAPVAVQVVEDEINLRLGDQVHIDRRVIVADGSVAAVAGEDVGGHRVVRLGADGLAYHADQSSEAHCLAILGLTTGAAGTGAPVSIRDAGPVEEASWSWTPDALVFLVGQGQLAQSMPEAGPIVVIGQAVSATRLVVTLQPRFF